MSDPTPQEHIRQLEAMQNEAPNGTPWAALGWAIPLLRAMYEIPLNPHDMGQPANMIGVLERAIVVSGGTHAPSQREYQGMVRWASPILRSYVARKRTDPPTKNTPACLSRSRLRLGTSPII